MNLASPLEHVRQRNLADRIADHLVAGIAKGEFIGGQRLRELELCQTLGVSRIPLREALRILQAQGVVVATPNQGTFVSDFDEACSSDMLEIRTSVERTAFARALVRAKSKPSVLEPVKERLHELRQAARLDNTFLYSKADLAFHESVVEISESPMLIAVWRALAPRVLFFMVKEKIVFSNYAEQILLHERLLEVLSNGTAESMQAEIGQHITHHVSREPAAHIVHTM